MSFNTPKQARDHRAITIADGAAQVSDLRRGSLPGPARRRSVNDLATTMADHAWQILDKQLPLEASVLFVTILRGGALLYPAFFQRFHRADFCFARVTKTQDGTHCEIVTPIAREQYDAVVYLDSMAITGTSLDATLATVGPERGTSTFAMLLWANRPVTESLISRGVTPVGFALNELPDRGLAREGTDGLRGDLLSSPHVA